MLMPIVLFCAFAVGGVLVAHVVSSGIVSYQQSTVQHMEKQLERLFLFNDAVKLSAAYLFVLLSAPVALYMSGFSLFICVALFIALLLMPRVVFSVLKKRRAKLINHALPDALAQLASAMRAGATFNLALQGYVEEEKGALGEELSLMLRQHRLGSRMEDALDNLAERIQSEEMDLVVSAVLIAQDVGGNLAEILQGLSTTIRRKLDMEGKIAALTSQGMMQGYVVSALPLALLGALSVVEAEATRPIFNSLLGWFALGVMVVLQCMGAFMISKIVKIQI